MGKSIYGCLCFLKRSEKTDTEVEYDGYFCSITDAVIIVTLVHSWATTEAVSKFLAQAFGIEKIISGHKIQPDFKSCSHQYIPAQFHTSGRLLSDSRLSRYSLFRCSSFTNVRI